MTIAFTALLLFIMAAGITEAANRLIPEEYRRTTYPLFFAIAITPFAMILKYSNESE